MARVRSELWRDGVLQLVLEHAPVNSLSHPMRLVLWEANPHPSMPVWHTQALSVPRGLRRRWNRLHRAALDFIADLL